MLLSESLRDLLTCSLGVTNNVSRAEDMPIKTSLPRLEQKLLGYPLALAVASLECRTGTLQIIALRHTAQTVRVSCHLVRQLNVIIRVDCRCGRYEHKELRLLSRCQVDSGEGAEDVGGTKLLVGIHPVNLYRNPSAFCTIGRPQHIPMLHCG